MNVNYSIIYTATDQININTNSRMFVSNKPCRVKMVLLS